MSTRPRAPVLALLVALALAPSVIAQPTRKPLRSFHPRSTVAAPAGAAKRWKINTHLFAANLALEDALDGTVNIPPFGDLPVAKAAHSALNRYPATYRAGVLGPDLFPEMYSGGWAIHSDLLATEGWVTDDWMRHVWSKARAWPKAEEQDRVMAFAYGWLTHAAGDMFAHTYVSRKGDGAWVSGPQFPKPHSTAIKHIVLEGFIGARTPETDITMDVWPTFVAEVLIKDPEVRRHTRNLKHYQTWLRIYDWIGPQLQKAKAEMNNNVRDDAPYWMKCVANPVPCARKEQLETWRFDIDHGLRALVDSSQTLGEKLMQGETRDGIGVMTGWASEWVPKMFGAHAVGEASAAMAELMDWANEPLQEVSDSVTAHVMRFLEEQVPYYYNLYESVKNPSYQMDHVEELGADPFPPGTKESISNDMHVRAGPDSLMTWHKFEPLYNSVILSKLALLDGDGLNELVKRAGLKDPLFAPGPSTNIMLGVVRSMTQAYQWVGDKVDYKADTIGPTKYNICGPEHVLMLPDTATVCGVRQRTYSQGGVGAERTTMMDVTKAGGGDGPVGGFALWGHPEAREKVFQVIFKGFGPGPGNTDAFDQVKLPAPAAGIGGASRTLRVVTEQVERMRERVAVIAEKTSGVIAADAAATVAAPPPKQAPPPVAGRIRLPGRVAPAPTKPAPAVAATPQNFEVITNWGERCCARDIAELRSALALIQAASGRLQDRAALTHLRRSSGADQLGARSGEVSAAIDAFANARDAQSAQTALARISAGIDALAKLVL